VRPARLREHLAEEDVGAVRVEQRYGVGVARIVGRGVNVVQGILRVGVGAVLGEEVRLVVLELVRRRLEKEGYCVLVVLAMKWDGVAHWADSRLAWCHQVRLAPW
jgi:hypothetical protein